MDNYLYEFEGITYLVDKNKKELLVCGYVRVKPPPVVPTKRLAILPVDLVLESAGKKLVTMTQLVFIDTDLTRFASYNEFLWSRIDLVEAAKWKELTKVLTQCKLDEAA